VRRPTRLKAIRVVPALTHIHLADFGPARSGRRLGGRRRPPPQLLLTLPLPRTVVLLLPRFILHPLLLLRRLHVRLVAQLLGLALVLGARRDAPQHPLPRTVRVI
jgi:hypothetical protein